MEDNSSDIEDLREEYKNELIMLNATLKKLDKDMDFSDIVRPLLLSSCNSLLAARSPQPRAARTFT